MNLSARFVAFINENKLFQSHEPVLLAVSGGKDSVLMAHLFAEAGFNFGIAHCNFKLRGKDSTADEELVKTLADVLQVPFYVTHFETVVYAKQQSISIEMAARELRYTWFEQMRVTHNYHYIALGHHQNDTVETMLLNLIRGTGIAGLHGILPKRNLLLRPLLFLNRNEVTDAVEARRLPYRDDESNFSTEYVRNKIRLEVVPILKEINPSLEKTFVANSKRFEELDQLLQLYSTTLRKELFIKKNTNTYQISIAKLQALHPLKTLVYELFKPYHFSSEVLTDLMNTWKKASRTGKSFYSYTHRLLVNRDELLLEEISTAGWSPQELTPNKSIDFFDRKIALRMSNEVKIVREENKIAIDAAHLVFPLYVRSWRDGDWFTPLGMLGKRKLSDFFISLKIALADKNKVPVLVNGNGDIIWVAPYRMDNRYKITDKTKKVAILECI